MKTLKLFLIGIIFISCTHDDNLKNVRYAKKQYYLGHDYFIKHIQSLTKIDKLRHENSNLAKEMRTLSLKGGQAASIASIRSSKKKIRKNQEQIKNEIVLSGRYLNAALTELKKAVIANNSLTIAHFELGLIYLKKATTIIDMSKRGQCLKGEFLKEKEGEASSLLANARKHFIQASKNKKLASKCHNNISALEIHFGNYDNAINHGKACLKDLVYQEGYVANSNIGWAFFMKKDYANSISYLKQALLLQSKYCLARYRLGRAFFENGKFKKSEYHLEKTLKQGPPCTNIQEAWLYLGLTQVKQEKIEKAIYTFTKCIEVAPSSCVAQKCNHHLKMVESYSDKQDSKAPSDKSNDL